MACMPLLEHSRGAFVGPAIHVLLNSVDEIIAFGIFHIQHGSVKNWQWLFIIEGVVTAVLAITAWFWMPMGPGSAWFLDKEDRAYAAERIRLDNVLYIQHKYSDSGVEKDTLTKRDVVETLRDWKLWYVLVFNILASVPGQAFSVFLPLVVKGLGYSSIKANLVHRSSSPPKLLLANRP